MPQLGGLKKKEIKMNKLMINEPEQSQEERAFAFVQRKAQAFIKSSILPANFKNIGDVIILDEMSRDLGVSMIMLAQQLFIVHGKSGMSGQLVLALLNKADKFDRPLMFEERESPWGVRAYSFIGEDRLNGEWIDDQLISANGWGSNPKWKTMKGQMAKYRAGTWFARVYAPEILMGFQEVEEINDVYIQDNDKPVKIESEPVDLNALVSKKEIETIEVVDNGATLVKMLIQQHILKTKAIVSVRELSDEDIKSYIENADRFQDLVLTLTAE